MKVSAALYAAMFAAFGVAGLAGCGDRDLAQPARDHRSVDYASVSSQDEGAARERPTRSSYRTDRGERSERSTERARTRLIDGKPMWSDSRRYSAEENVAYQFEHHGEELGARDLDDFVSKAHRFVSRPPEGTLTLTRANGDKLLYDAKSGLFGVVREDGAPRTVFKPRDGEAYWATQVRDNEGRSQTARRRSSRDEG